MGLFDKIPFLKKKDDDLDLGPDPFADTPGPAGNQAGGQDPNSFGNQSQGGYGEQGTANMGALPDNQAFPSNNQDPFADPLSGQFAPDPTLGDSQNSRQPAQYPSAAPLPGRQQQPIQYGNAPTARQEQYYDEAPSRDVELILAKLDAIKAELDSVHQRVRKLEQIADQQQASNQTAQQSSTQRRYSW